MTNCGFFSLSELEEMKSCKSRVEAANAWMRLEVLASSACMLLWETMFHLREKLKKNSSVLDQILQSLSNAHPAF